MDVIAEHIEEITKTKKDKKHKDKKQKKDKHKKHQHDGELVSANGDVAQGGYSRSAA